jgi:hypothetical protein
LEYRDFLLKFEAGAGDVWEFGDEDLACFLCAWASNVVIIVSLGLSPEM